MASVKVQVDVVGEEQARLTLSFLSSSDQASLDEFSCSWSDFWTFFRSATEENNQIGKEDYKDPQKIESFLTAILNRSGLSEVYALSVFRMRQCGSNADLTSRISKLESENADLRQMLQELMGTVNILKARLDDVSRPVHGPVSAEKFLIPTSPSEGIEANGDESDQSRRSSVLLEEISIISTSDTCLQAYPRFERELDEFVRMLQPREAQISFRQEAAALMKSHIQKALRCNAFVVSYSKLKCFLPDDPMKITVVLNHAALSTWHKILYDRLVILSEQHDIRAESSLLHDNGAPDAPYKVRDVKLISDADTFKISGFMDNMPFEIVGNGRVDLTMLAFFEEVGSLVGNDHLLKRSVLLIRAWWWYESMLEGEKSPRDYLPDGAIWLMTAALFNIYHRLIVDPLQALYLFLKTYGSFDGKRDIVTLYGLKRVQDGATFCNIDRDDREYLIPAKLFEKYYNVVNVTHDGSLNLATNSSQQWKMDNSSLVILNPFTMENITLEKLSNRKVEKIQLLFRQGLQHLKSVFDDTNAVRGALVSTVFPETMRSLLSGTARRDTASSAMRHPPVGNSDYMEMMKSPRDVYFVEVSQLWHEILFCNFILQGIVSESALLSLCAEVLTERKILPVGEVGKIVSDIVASPFLSSQLKEKFGGLKKFLEKYPEIFVFSKDHPFNPHVVLKKFLTQEQMEMVEAGTSLQAIFKSTGKTQQQHHQFLGQGASNNNSMGGGGHSGQFIMHPGRHGGDGMQTNHRKQPPQNRHSTSRLEASGLFGHSLQHQHSADRNLFGNRADKEHSSHNQMQSSLALDMTWKPMMESRSFGSNMWGDSISGSSNSGSSNHFKNSSFSAQSQHSNQNLQSQASSDVPRLRGVDDSFGSRYRPSNDNADRLFLGNSMGGMHQHQQLSIGPSSSSSSSYSIFPAQSGPNQSFDQQSPHAFLGNPTSLLNSPPQQQSNSFLSNLGRGNSQSQNDSFFPYGHSGSKK